MVFFLPCVEAWAVMHARIAQQDVRRSDAEDAPAMGHTQMSQNRITVAKPAGSTPSPFRFAYAWHNSLKLTERGEAEIERLKGKFAVPLLSTPPLNDMVNPNTGARICVR
jgi:hypothetical protein